MTDTENKYRLIINVERKTTLNSFCDSSPAEWLDNIAVQDRGVAGDAMLYL